MIGFSGHLLELARRKERLIIRAGEQRAEVAAALRRWEKPVSVLDRGIAAVHFLKEHPLLAAGVFGAAMALGRRRLLIWAGRGLIAWRAWRAVDDWARPSR
jgi:hypothetical protein